MNSSSASGWIGGLLPLWMSFLMLPVTIRIDSEAVKVDRVHAIQHCRNSAEMPLREGDERRLPPAVVYLHCHPCSIQCGVVPQNPDSSGRFHHIFGPRPE